MSAGSSAHRMSDHRMKRTYFPGITDIVVVTDPAEIRTICKRFKVRPRLHRTWSWLQIAASPEKFPLIFSLNGRLFPTILPRTNPSRAAEQDELVVETKRQG